VLVDPEDELADPVPAAEDVDDVDSAFLSAFFSDDPEPDSEPDPPLSFAPFPFDEDDDFAGSRLSFR
jgi:hypothetical protein